MAKSAGKVEQNRQHRMRRFADASLHIVATEGLAPPAPGEDSTRTT